MTPDFLTVGIERDVEHALRVLRACGVTGPALHTVLLTNPDGTLAGNLDITQLLQATPNTPLTALNNRHCRSVPPHASLPEIAVEMADFDLAAIAIIDQHRRPIGIVRIDDIIALTIPHHWRHMVGTLAHLD